MIDWTNTHFRVFMRLLAPYALLYTEMQTVQAILNNQKRALFYNAMESPLALQLGGACPTQLVQCAIMAEQAGFSEINLNLGCPSDRVQKGQFGACLMGQPQIVMQCVRAIKNAVSIPVTAKTRIGIDDNDSYEFFSDFAERLIESGCDKLIVHARKAWLHGLNPKQNRTIPPLHYDYVYRIKEQFPSIPIIINGNIQTIEDITTHMQYTDGVMLGRLACQNPYQIALIHRHYYPEEKIMNRKEILEAYFNYLDSQMKKGGRLSVLLKPILNMSHGLVGSKRWKFHMTSFQRTNEIGHLQEALASFEDN